MGGVRELLQMYRQFDPDYKFFSTFLIFMALWGLRIMLRRVVSRRFEQERSRILYNWLKAVDYTVLGLGIILIGRIWLEGIQSLATYLGLVSAGLAIALQDPIINLVGWAFIVWRRPFVVGNRVEIGGIAGDVIDIGFFEFHMLEIGNWVDADQSTGRIIHVPNGTIFREALSNYNQGVPYIWNEIPVLVTFESDWEKAKGLLQEVIDTHAPEVKRRDRVAASRFVINYEKLTPILYTNVASSGVLLTLRYMVAPRQRRHSEQVMWEAILRAFAPHWDIDLAYETTREFLHYREGKKPPAPSAKRVAAVPMPTPKAAPLAKPVPPAPTPPTRVETVETAVSDDDV